MAKQSNTAEATDNIETIEAPVANKIPRVRKVILTPVATDTLISLSAEVIGHDTINFELETSELQPQFLNQLALRGLASFIHDKTASAKDVSTIPAEIAKVLAAVKDGTIFENTRKRVDNVELPKFVEAIMVRDNLDRTDKEARQEALDAWHSLSKEEKAAIRSDETLKNHVDVLNGEAARAKLTSGL